MDSIYEFMLNCKYMYPVHVVHVASTSSNVKPELGLYAHESLIWL